jgi:hypothetical protein
MGPLSSGRRTVRPEAFAETHDTPAAEHQTGTPKGLWLGVAAGVLVCLGLVVAVGQLGSEIPLHVRGALLGALTGVLLAPFIAMSSFVSMLVLPFSLEGIFGDSLWTRVARACYERKLRLLFLPLLFYVVLPSTLCALGGSRVKSIEAPLVISAALGAMLLGAILGGMCGTALSKGPQPSNA